MKTKRGIAQVVFNFLPDQTADLGGAIWRVERWAEPRLVAVDEHVLRAEIMRSTYPWTAVGRDSDLADDLVRGQEISVLAPSEDGYVAVESFPRNYRCTVCGRIEDTSERTCKCGADSWRQFAFVTYHECGRSETPWIPRCPTHRQVRVDIPRSAATSDLVFECPVCHRQTSKGFPFKKCECGNGTIKYNVHRAAVVYTARSTVIVNPPSRARAEALRAAGARDRVLEWILEGMRESDPLAGAPTVDVLVAQLIESGVPEEAARAAAAVAAEKSGGVVGGHAGKRPELTADKEAIAVDAALQLAYATSGGRVRADDLVATAGPAMRARYEHSYPDAVSRGGLVAVELLDDFPVLDAVYGYTRGGQAAGESTLRPFRSRGGALRIHGQLAHTEALLFRLDPLLVARWLASHGHLTTVPADEVEARALILENAVIPRPGDVIDIPTLGSDLLQLIHSYSHRVMRRASSFCGIDRDSLSEYLVPLHLSFAVFASTRGDFVLGGLQALFEHDLDTTMIDIVSGEHRCALDPGCTSHGSACVACLHVGEPSCRYFNQFLSRETLFGDHGYLALAGV